MPTTPTRLSEPIVLADLPLPPDVAGEIETYCREHRLHGRQREDFEEEVRLSHFFSGNYVVAALGPRGLEIHAIDSEEPDGIYELRKRLRAEGNPDVISLIPLPWKDPITRVGYSIYGP